MSTNTIIGRKLVVALGVLGGMSLMCSLPMLANAQVKPNKGGQVLRRIGPLPDLVTSVNVPAQINQQGTGTVTVRVDNVYEAGPAVATLPGLVPPGSPAVAGVALRVLFAGYQVTAVQGNSGFNCQPTGAGGTAPNTGVQCSAGAIAAGASATITVSVKELGSPVHYCGPLYTDAFVDQGNAIAERSEANNRALGVTDTAVCIN